MDNPTANQLPEVDSLPDGFVDGSIEPLAPSTPTRKLQNQPDYKEHNLLESDRLSDSSNRVVVNQFVSIEGTAEKAHKCRTFPVPLAVKDGYDASSESAELFDRGFMDQRGAASNSYEPSATTSEIPVDCQLQECPDDEKETDKLEFKATQGGLDIQADRSKEAYSSENQKTQKDTTEVKHKSSKRTFRTEREFLEFTLRYQQVLAERDAAISVRDKLESLCRELQRQNKTLKEECKRISDEGQNLRKDLSTKFDEAIQNVSEKLEEQKGEFFSQMKENEMLRDKLKHFADQHALSEQQYARQLKQKELELKIAELKIQQHEEKLKHEQAQMKLYSEQVTQLLATEKHLKSQLTADGEKFQQFQDALVKSNGVFETYKQEIEKMVKSTKDLKKENTFLKSKCEKSDYTLVELLGERELLKKQLEKAKNQKEKLESLCRSLQAERKQSLNGNSSNDSVHLPTISGS
ncbi:hypothetical protein Dimus_021180 [Dionaea muscipula]